MKKYQLTVALLIMQLSCFGAVQAQDQPRKHALSIITETQLGIGYEASNAINLETLKTLPTLPVGERNALIVRTLERIGQAEHGIMPGQLKTPRYEQIFVAATSRIFVVKMLHRMIQQAGDDYTSSLALAVLNAEHAWLQMILRNRLNPEDYLSLSRKFNSDLLKLMLTDVNFKTSYDSLAGENFIKPQVLANALFIVAVANTCAENSRLCDRALPE
jgi:hypothetical protein